ncbi:hypothetical protein [Streptomyces sp. NPDC088246]
MDDCPERQDMAVQLFDAIAVDLLPGGTGEKADRRPRDLIASPSTFAKAW